MNIKREYDVIIIGSGPGGFHAASCAVDAGLSVAIIEKGDIGGVCLNVGCMPTKTLVHGAAFLNERLSAESYGIKCAMEALQVATLIEKKDQVVATLRKGMEASLKKLAADYYHGEARLSSDHEVFVGDDVLTGKSIIIATGSRPREIPGFAFDGKTCVSSSDILELKDFPKSIVIVGGGVIGCEWASLLHSFGVHVTLIEMTDRLLPLVSVSVSKRLESMFKRKQIDIRKNTKVLSQQYQDGQVHVVCDAGDPLVADMVLVCVGRVPNADGFGGEAIGLVYEKGCVKTNEYLQTNIPHIYAIGDVIDSPQLAHVASYEAGVAVHNILNSEKKQAVSYDHIPSCVYTDPEVASVGVTEKCDGVAEVRMPLAANGKAHCESATDGTVSLFFNTTNGTVLGAEMIGKHGTELIATFGMAVRCRLTVTQIADVVFPHPTFAEVIHSVAELAKKQLDLRGQ